MKSAIALVLTALAACGASVSETRMVAVAPRPAGCSLELVQADMTQLVVGGPWEMLGTVSISRPKVVEPLAASNRAIVDPRACRMGGSAIAVMSSAVFTSSAAVHDDSAVIFAVLRPREQQELLTGDGGRVDGALGMRAPRPAAQLAYREGPGCVTRDELADEVSAKLGYSPWQDAAELRFVVDVEPARGAFHATVQGPDGAVKSFDGATCRAVTDAVATAIAVRLDGR